MTKRQTSLSANIVGFCRYLRQQNFSLSVEEEANALEALQFIHFQTRDIFRLALKATLCRSRSQIEQFDNLFTDYWKELQKAVDEKISTQSNPTLKKTRPDSSFKSLQSWLNSNKSNKEEKVAAYSNHENLSQKDFSAVPDDDVNELLLTIQSIAKKLAAKANRRYERSSKNKFPDIRQTLRKNMRSGGELMQLSFRKPKRNRVKLVMLCDVSKSMDLYSSFLIQFMYAFQQVYSKTETFSFSTSLQRITQVIRKKNFEEAIESLNTANKGWGDGTQIGESLHRFVEDFAPSLLNKKTIVIILSDGWDSGNVSLLDSSMGYMRSKAKKIIWLNPLAGYEHYKPDTAAMKTAMPYVDVLASAHNADSLKKLVKWL
jgi:uncharacterized protein